jgi:hypothetical protein
MVTVSDAGAKINSSNLVSTDIDASNGVIHVIDTVLMPPGKQSNARKTLENAVAKGAVLFNAGHHDECATVYKNAMQELMSTEIDSSLCSMLPTARHARRLNHGHCEMGSISCITSLVPSND